MFNMAETQQTHRHTLEKSVIWNNILMTRLGLACGFVIALYGLHCSVLIAQAGQGTASAVIGGASLVGLASVFVYGRSEQGKNLLAKREAVESR
jgi:uncharacterized membrane protein